MSMPGAFQGIVRQRIRASGRDTGAPDAHVLLLVADNTDAGGAREERYVAVSAPMYGAPQTAVGMLVTVTPEPEEVL